MSYYGMNGADGLDGVDGLGGTAKITGTAAASIQIEAMKKCGPLPTPSCIIKETSKLMDDAAAKQEASRLKMAREIAAKVKIAARDKAFRGSLKLNLPAVFQGTRNDPMNPVYKLTHNDAVSFGKSGILWVVKGADKKLPFYANGRVFGSLQGFGADVASAPSPPPPPPVSKLSPTGLRLPSKKTPVRLPVTGPSVSPGPKGAFMALPPAFVSSSKDAALSYYRKTHDDVFKTLTGTLLWVTRNTQDIPFYFGGKPAKLVLSKAAPQAVSRLFPVAKTVVPGFEPSGESDRPVPMPRPVSKEMPCPAGFIMAPEGCIDVSAGGIFTSDGKQGTTEEPPPVDVAPVVAAVEHVDAKERSAIISRSWWESMSTGGKIAVGAAGASAALLLVAGTYRLTRRS